MSGEWQVKMDSVAGVTSPAVPYLSITFLPDTTERWDEEYIGISGPCPERMAQTFAAAPKMLELLRALAEHAEQMEAILGPPLEEPRQSQLLGEVFALLAKIDGAP